MEILFKELLTEAVNSRYTDIHVTKEKTHGLIRIRSHGQMHMHSEIDLITYQKMINYLKFIADLDTNEHRVPQSGRTIIKLKNKNINIRISSLPISLMNEIIVIRILNSVEHIPSNQLFREDSDFQYLVKTTKQSSGLILFTGPTGSGKSTVMFRLLAEIVKSKSKQIITIEDPIEFDIPNIVQVEINEKAKLDYEPLLRGVLRCDPDVIMFGEIRDKKIAFELIKASLSGHLVFSTFHSKSAYSTIVRLKEYGFLKEELREAVTMIVNQRIIHDKNTSFIVYEILTNKEICSILDGKTTKYTTINDKLTNLNSEGFLSNETYETCNKNEE